MNVQMEKMTRWNGETLKPGDEIEVDSNTAQRWINKKIATAVEVANTNETKKDSNVDEEFEELKERAQNIGIKNWHKKKKATLQKDVDEHQKLLGEALDKAAELNIEGYEDMSLEELTTALQANDDLVGAAIDKAVELDIEGYEEMNLGELQAAIAEAEKED